MFFMETPKFLKKLRPGKDKSVKPKKDKALHPVKDKSG